MNAVTKLPQSFWRFTLRELFLLTLAVGAMLGWGGLLLKQFQRFEATSYYQENSDWREAISGILKELGEEGSGPGGFAATESWGRSTAHRAMSYRFQLSAANSSSFIKAFQIKVQERMTAAGCIVQSSASSNSGAAQAIVLGYRCRPNSGVTEISFFPSDGQHARLVVSMHEERTANGGSSVGASSARVRAEE